MEQAAKHATLLFVDDEENILRSLKRLFRPEGYRIHIATGGSLGLSILEDEKIDLVISDMRMPGMNGAEFLEQVAKQWPNVIRILLTGYSEMESTIAAVNKGRIYSYVSKPWEDNDLRLTVKQALSYKDLEDEKKRLEALTRQQNETLNDLNASLEEKVSHRTEELRQTVGFLELAHTSLKDHFKTTVEVFANLIEIREGVIAGHSRRIATLARSVAERMELGEKALEEIYFAALLHDIGKIALPDALINKAYNTLNAEEREKVEKHPVLGQAALMTLAPLQETAVLIRSHHERFDGRGYPDKLREQEIPLGARILSIANDYDALQIGTLTQQHLPQREAIQFISRESGSRYDPEIVDLFIPLLKTAQNETQGDENKNERCFKSSALREGMITTRDIIFNNGVLLLSKKHRLSQEMIQNIFKFEVAMGCDIKVYVRT